MPQTNEERLLDICKDIENDEFADLVFEPESATGAVYGKRSRKVSK
jgi:hypothetical protein